MTHRKCHPVEDRWGPSRVGKGQASHILRDISVEARFVIRSLDFLTSRVFRLSNAIERFTLRRKGRWHARLCHARSRLSRHPGKAVELRSKPAMQSDQSAARHNEHCVVVAPIERVSALRARLRARFTAHSRLTEFLITHLGTYAY